MARWATVAAAAAVLAGGGVAVVVPYVVPPAATAASSLDATVGYLQRSQNADGGFPATRGGASDPATTVWVALALASVKAHPEDQVRKAGDPSAWQYLKRHARELTRTDDLSRLLMVVAAMEKPAGAVGFDLVARLRERVLEDGSRMTGVPATPGGSTPDVEASAWATLGFVAAGKAGLLDQGNPSTAIAGWLKSVEDPSGGWARTVKPPPGSGAPSVPSRVDTTALVLQAMKAASIPTGGVGGASFLFLREKHNVQGAFPATPDGKPDAYATALVVQAYRAQGVAPKDILGNGQNGATWLVGDARARDGSYGGSVLRTAQVTPGANAVPFPLSDVDWQRTAPEKERPERDDEKPKDDGPANAPTSPEPGSSAPSGDVGTESGSGSGSEGLEGAALGSQGDTAGAAPSSTSSAEASGPRGTGGDAAQQQEQQQKTQTGPTPPADGGQDVTGTVVGGVQDEQDAAAPGLRAGGGGDDGGGDGVTAGLGGGVLVMAALGALLEARRPRRGSVLGEAPALELAGAAPAGPAAAAPEAATAPADAAVPGTAPADAATAAAPAVPGDAARPADAPHGAGVRGPNPAAG
ncbi:prenyltransferase/squalene oxidase repeat-containing protein [Patulibacter sp. SYSU D01012]|uniref:prenyltransferase/squalene oxidase repeat-containing protein n=1 Tax=Patulibacter sp. SYSU D01012 TaxID=2817381 RepID=UPI001B304EEA